MTIRHHARSMVALILTLCLLLGVGLGIQPASANASPGADPFGKYDPPLTIHVVEETTSDRKYLPDESFDNNAWTEAYESELGITFDYLWTADTVQYAEKMNIMLATDDLPDIMVVDYEMFYRLAKAGRLQPIDDVFAQYASPMLKENMSKGEGIIFSNCSVDGKLYGIADAPDVMNRNFLWVRDDWMQKLSLQPPQTMEDVEAIAKAFTTMDPNGNGKDDTFGLGIDKSIWSGGMDMSGFANGYHASPRMWVEKDGALVYGSVQPEMRALLSKLQEFYKAGYLDPEFALKDTWDKAPDTIRSSKVGMFYGQLWVPLWSPLSDLIAATPEATWSHYPIPSCDDQPALSYTDVHLGKVLCVTEKCGQKDAVVKIANFILAKLYDEEMAEQKYHDQDGVETFWGSKFIEGVPGFEFYNYICADKIKTAMATGDMSALNPEQQGYYEAIKRWLDSKDTTAWGTYAVFGDQGTMMTTMDLVKRNQFGLSLYTGPSTETMAGKKANLDQKEEEIFTKIIMGDPIEKFDEWVSYFAKQGGDQITKEVNDWWSTQPK